MSGSPFWKFSLAVYGTPGVPDACLRLQDQSGADVNVVLYLLWLAVQGRELSEAQVRQAADSVDSWRAGVVVPLRTARRALKEPPALLVSEAAATLRNKVKALELEAERLQQEALYGRGDAGALGVNAQSLRQAAEDNLGHYARVLATGFDAAALGVVISAGLAVTGTGKA